MVVGGVPRAGRRGGLDTQLHHVQCWPIVPPPPPPPLRELVRRYGQDGILSLPVNPRNIRGNTWDGTSAILMFLFNRLLVHCTNEILTRIISPSGWSHT
ncbi:hypothetical protein F4778DRAFT_643418 [Xylariomycetidae sp. FL2044]|nr:hypothetical protein F4778DRAFT_643418 [Xylariomycetidae sp. FL2044]